MMSEWVGLGEALRLVSEREECIDVAKRRILEKLRWGELTCRSEFAFYSGLPALPDYVDKLDVVVPQDAEQRPIDLKKCSRSTTWEDIPRNVYWFPLSFEWEEGTITYFSDQYIENACAMKFTGVHIRLTDLRRIWELAIPSQTEQKQIIYSTGLPGRPTSRGLFETEFRRRAEAKECKSSLSAEAKSLSNWLSREHPNASPATPKTIENHLRSLYRQLNQPLKR
jgi:hypothetical protein